MATTSETVLTQHLSPDLMPLHGIDHVEPWVGNAARRVRDDGRRARGRRGDRHWPFGLRRRVPTEPAR